MISKDAKIVWALALALALFITLMSFATYAGETHADTVYVPVPGPSGPPGDVGPQGPPGVDGVTPTVLLDGCTLSVNGTFTTVCGADGAQGVQGVQGEPGMLDTKQFEQLRSYMSATNALQVHMPTEAGKTRLTVGAGSAYGERSYSFGVARMFRQNERPIVSAGYSKARTESVWQIGASIEF